MYNENLKDLLSDSEDDDPAVNDPKRQIRIFDNNNNNSSIMVKGMQEIFINSAHEGLNLLMQGSLKGKWPLLNATIFHQGLTPSLQSQQT